MTQHQFHSIWFMALAILFAIIAGDGHLAHNTVVAALGAIISSLALVLSAIHRWRQS